MILIFSIENDPSTNDVLNWLLQSKIDFVRVNPSDVWYLVDLTITNNCTEWSVIVNDKLLRLSEIKSIWYRRGLLKLDQLDISQLKNHRLKEVLSKEISIIEEFMIDTLRFKPCIGDFKGVVNKLIVLEEAKRIGLKIPDSTILKDKSEIHWFEELISKPIFEVETFADKRGVKKVSSYTTSIQLESIAESFFYSLFQKCIEKDFEVRTFCIDNAFYSAAIFSQRNEQTKVDYRHYDDDYPNRVIPFKLPNEIERKLQELLLKLRINTGSIDLIHSKGEYYFLEINPVGQFGMVGYPCNYNLEKIIADKLIS